MAGPPARKVAWPVKQALYLARFSDGGRTYVAADDMADALHLARELVSKATLADCRGVCEGIDYVGHCVVWEDEP